MASYTNVEIPDFYSSAHRLQERVEDLELRLGRVTRERDSMVKEMENIMLAVREWGFVDLRTETGKDRVRLIEAPTEEKKD